MGPIAQIQSFNLTPYTLMQGQENQEQIADVNEAGRVDQVVKPRFVDLCMAWTAVAAAYLIVAGGFTAALVVAVSGVNKIYTIVFFSVLFGAGILGWICLLCCPSPPGERNNLTSYTYVGGV